ncbi:hypothetical protein G1H11_15335 [Phytoactinopolyspora alkaliphila]|uniref:Uncharacterized protein n=1 Tax=Phytoactinopolyspora alkaliphila TaxID=1783498 RepID=A0A6N9YNY4_9ACTN|nr:hypothetical protein [Phytoactinopolyspora alkaliphila]NED96682.1 hypothetical protein [Phytoactinopolyspora alkaliphila]
MSDDEAYQPDPQAIAADLADGPVHIDPAVADAISDENLEAINVAIAGADPSVFVLAVPLTYNSEVSANQLVSLVHRELPQDGVYFVSRVGAAETWNLEVTRYGVGTGNDDALATYVARDLYPSDLGLQLSEAVELFTGGTAREVYEEHIAERNAEASEVEPAGDGSGGIFGLEPPAVIGGGVVLVVAVLLAAVLPKLRARGAHRREVQVKDRALQRISSAQTNDWRRRAETESAALGERIRTLQIGKRANGEAWRAALDHYQAGTAVLDRSTDAADSIGALVLTRRGEDALSLAVAGKPWKPSAACFFNPLHGTATTTAVWTTPAGTREVPCCAACRRDVRKSREPDILDLPHGSTVVHYMDSGVEPWASTGYGSLAPDLLDRLRTR